MAKEYSRREVIVGAGSLLAGGALMAGMMQADSAQAASLTPGASVGHPYLNPLAQAPATLDITPISPDYFIPDRFKGKTMLITGGARGIGQATAIRAAREGANIAILDWLPKEGQATADQIVKEGGKAIFIQGNVQKSEDCNRMVEETVKEFGELNYALNNAGVLDGVYSGDEFDFEAQRPLMPNFLHLSTDEYFDAVLATNISGIFKSLRPELGQMLAQGKGGAIVNVGSIAGLIGLAGNPAYSASKHAVTGITRGTAIDYAPYGIRVNSVNMAATDTPMIARAGQFVAASRATMPEGTVIMGSIKTQSLLAYADSNKRPATTWEQGAIILFLLSDDASNLTGCTYATDGGWTAY